MSGICGIFRPGSAVGVAELAPMLATLTLPGETGHEQLTGSYVGFGVARRWDFQQLGSIPGVRIAVDADLCNTPELIKIAQQGAGNVRLSLAEILAWLYKLKGADFLLLLRGACSLVLWDEQEQRLLLAVDRLGINSLYWQKERDGLLFASRAGGIRAAQESPAEVSHGSIAQLLLFSAVPAPLTIYRGMQKLEPGCLWIYERGQLRRRQYWDMSYAESENSDIRLWASKVRKDMRRAVQAHLQGCVSDRTGAYLSGGTDSSSVVALMSEVHAPANTFSIFFEDPRYSEIGYARITAQKFGTQHHEKSVIPTEAFDSISKIVEYYDEPFANSSAIGAYFCAQLARENGVDTLLAGDGGDELFAGNQRYVTDLYFQLYHRLPDSLKNVIEPVAGLLPVHNRWLNLPRRYVRRAQIPNPRRILSYAFLLAHEPEEVFEPEFLVQTPRDTWLEIAENHFQRAPQARSELNRLLYLDVKMTLADNDLRKVLGTAELAGVRVRFPLLDHDLAELSGSIPSHLKLKRFQKRYIFKQAMKGILPDQVIHKKKHGFGVPVGSWMLKDARFRELVQDVLSDRSARERNYFRKEFLQKLQRLHQQYPNYYGEMTWSLVILELWYRRNQRQVREYAL